MAVATKDEILRRVQDIIAEQLGVEWRDAKPEYNIRDDINTDSLDEVEILMALEDEFNVEISDEDADALHTVQQIVDYLAGREVA